MNLIPRNRPDAINTVLRYFAEQKKHRILLISKYSQTRPQGLEGDFITAADFIKKTQPKKFLELFLRVRQERLRSPHHTAQLMDQYRKPEWNLQKKTTVVLDPSFFRAAEFKTIIDYLMRKKCKVMLMEGSQIAKQIHTEISQNHDRTVNMKMGMKL